MKALTNRSHLLTDIKDQLIDIPIDQVAGRLGLNLQRSTNHRKTADRPAAG
jgi:hypothetical protein